MYHLCQETKVFRVSLITMSSFRFLPMKGTEGSSLRDSLMQFSVYFICLRSSMVTGRSLSPKILSSSSCARACPTGRGDDMEEYKPKKRWPFESPLTTTPITQSCWSHLHTCSSGWRPIRYRAQLIPLEVVSCPLNMKVSTSSLMSSSERTLPSSETSSSRSKKARRRFPLPGRSSGTD